MESTFIGKGKKRKRFEAKSVKNKKKPIIDKDNNFFCKKPKHRKDCPRCHTWHLKKGIPHTLVCYEVNLAFVVSRNTWWLDSGASTHISVSMKGYLNYRKPTDVERYIYVGDGKSIEVEAISHFKLLLETGYYLDLIDTFVVPSFRRNLVSIFVLEKSRYSCLFGNNNKFVLSINSNIVGTGSLICYDKLYLLENIASYQETLHASSHGTKHKINHENLGSLRHKRLGHISKQRIERLV